MSDRKIELRVFDSTGKSERNRVKQVQLVGLGAVQAEEIDLVPIDRLVITMFLDGGSLALTALLLDRDFEVSFAGARLPVRGAGASARVRDLLLTCLAGQPVGAPSSSPPLTPAPVAPPAGAPAPERPAGSVARPAADDIHTKTHALITEDHTQAVPFEGLLAAELRAYDEPGRRRVSLDGPRVLLASELAVPVGMARHELATNAIRHGALGDPDGRLKVT